MDQVDRIRSIKAEQEKAFIRADEQKIGAAVLMKQMEERQADRIRQQELREQDAQAMIQRIRELEEKENEERNAKVVAGRKLLEQVMHANNAQGLLLSYDITEFIIIITI
jgi:23S rRNA A2030 N6-methylase RlmJ